jgi:excisionase family DNA binding protein
VRPLDVATRYHSEHTGIPLITAAQAAELRRVKTRTIYQWVRRGKLEVAGLGDNGEQLFDASDVAALCPVAA